MDNTVKAVAFDIDGTLVAENFWGALNALSGMNEATDMLLMKRYHGREITYREWMRLIADIHRKNPQSRDAIEAITQEYVYAPGAKEAVAHALNKYEVALISSNIDVFVERIRRDLGIQHAYWFTDMRYDAGGVFSDIGFAYEGDELTAKTWALNDFARKAGVQVTEVAFVGDSRNDLAAFVETGKGILVGNGDEELRNAAWKQIPTISELTAIL